LGWLVCGAPAYHVAGIHMAIGEADFMRFRLLALLLAVTLSAQAKTALLEHVPLQWKPTSELQLGTAQMSQAPIEFETFQDVRDNKQAIGENDEDSTPKPVTTTDDVGAFVSTHMRALFGRAGLKTVDSDATVIIKGDVQQFYVRETSTYKAEVAVRLTVMSRDGKTLWTGLASGEATRFGRSYKVENYYEVLSDAIVNTVSSMLESEQFQAALSGR
jgi:hypothetical protein